LREFDDEKSEMENVHHLDGYFFLKINWGSIAFLQAKNFAFFKVKKAYILDEGINQTLKISMRI
jgi:hypothetical protein